jgi:hypothetical protein
MGQESYNMTVEFRRFLSEPYPLFEHSGVLNATGKSAQELHDEALAQTREHFLTQGGLKRLSAVIGHKVLDFHHEPIAD